MNDTTTDAATLFAPLWKRKWLILIVAILVGAGTYVIDKRQTPVYKATTQLFLGNAEQAGAGGAKSTLSGRALADQVGLINSTVIGAGVHKRLRAEGDRAAARGKATATASGSSDFITITTEAHTPRGAVNLANGYAQAYIKEQRGDYLRGVKTQIANAREQLRRIEPPLPTPGKGKVTKSSASSSATIQAATLASKISQLESSLSTYSGVQQVSPARADPLPISPAPKRNAIFGFVLGLILASVAAYALSRLDRRLRSLADIESIFQTQILAMLPAVRSPIARPDGQRAPAKSLLEPLRRLHTTLQLGDMLERGHTPRVIVFLSADAGDGRSTVIANLARVQSEAGERVAVIEADFRRPTQAALLDTGGTYGLADVIAGKISLGEAMQVVKSTDSLDVGGHTAAAPAPAAVSTVVGSRSIGSLSVLLSGGPASNPPALLARPEMAELLGSLGEEFDHVLIDAPPPLEVSDVMPLLQLADGIVIVARVGHTREVSAQRLAQLLGRTASAPLLGVVANCVPRKDIERYGFSSAPAGPRARRLVGR
jgi:Mrp family chromosome partitioning ATPase